jgi:S-adenosylmethionine hydrolase
VDLKHGTVSPHLRNAKIYPKSRKKKAVRSFERMHPPRGVEIIQTFHGQQSYARTTASIARNEQALYYMQQPFQTS